MLQTLQYYIHNHILHDPNGNTLSNLHQCWHHSIRTPYSFVAAYDHPICYLLHRFLPLYLPAIAFRFHIMTYLLLLAVFSLEELFTYSGYNVLPSTIMLRGMARRVDAHMLSEGDGNFGPVGVLDWVHGTTLGGDVMDDLRSEMEKHDVQERTGKAVGNAGDAANGAVNGVASKAKRRLRKGRG
jgi:sterol desaturase/sphingolipid hydroxylase (fatty acid hydroxylase superfamily)